MATMDDIRAADLARYLTTLDRAFGIPASRTARDLDDADSTRDAEQHLETLQGELHANMKLLTPPQRAMLGTMQIRSRRLLPPLQWQEAYERRIPARVRWEAEEDLRLAIVHDALASLAPEQVEAINLGLKRRRYRPGANVAPGDDRDRPMMILDSGELGSSLAMDWLGF